MRKLILGGGLSAAALILACDDEPVGPHNTNGLLVVQVTFEQPSQTPSAISQGTGIVGLLRNPPAQDSLPLSPTFSFVQLDAVEVTIYQDGQLVTTVNMDREAGGFRGTSQELDPGTYQVVVLGFEQSGVTWFAQQNAAVTAGSQTTATVTLATFQPQVATLDLKTTALNITANWGAISSADSFQIEFADNPNFDNPDSFIEPDSPRTKMFSVTSADTYYVRVKALNSLAGTRGAFSDPASTQVVTDTIPSGNDAATAAPLGFGAGADTTLSGLNILPAGDVDWFSFEACAGDSVEVIAKTDSLTPPSSLQAVLTLFNQDGSERGSDTTTGTADKIIAVPLSVSGPYFIKVASKASSMGEYELTLDVTPGPLSNEQLAACVTVSVVITPSADTLTSLGDTVTLSAVALAFGDTISGITFTWSSSDNSIATVDSTGLVTALGNDTATITATATPGGASGSAAITVQQQATKLAFTTQPSDTVAGNTIAPVKVTAYDALDSVATNFTGSVTVDTTAGTGKPGATLSGTATRSAVAGVATFADLSIDSAGTGYTLDASATGLQSATSDLFNIAAGAATKLTFTKQPSNTLAGATIAPVEVTAYDAVGNVAIDFTGSVTVDTTAGTGRPGATLSGTTTRSAVAGVATFADLSIDSASTGYTLTATSASLTPDTSTPFDINPVAVVITPAADTLTALGDTDTLSAVAQDASGSTIGSITFTWSSNNESIATVDGNGVVTAVANGTATITATAPGGASDNASITVRPFTVVTAGRNHSCGLTTDGAAYCWGRNADGQLGVGDSTNSAFPVAVAINGVTFQSIAAGGFHTCALTTGGAVYCWGQNNSHGQLGNASFMSSPIPVAVTGSYQSIAAGTNHTCGITTTDAAYCWGRNNHGQLGNNDNNRSNVPVPVASSESFKSISAGNRHTCGVTTSDVGYCWGGDGDGQLGNGPATGSDVLVPVTVQTSLTFKSISADKLHTCGVTTSDVGYCWGADFSGQLGNGNVSTQQHVPVAVATSLMFQSIATGEEHTCGIATTDAPQCWGNNSSGQLGDSSTVERNVPVAVQTSLTFQSISAGENHTCGLTTAGAIYCWGENSTDQLGNDSAPTDSNVPVRVFDP